MSGRRDERADGPAGAGSAEGTAADVAEARARVEETDAEIRRLLGEGELLPAAERLCAAGRHEEAAELFARIVMDARAAECARHAGDRVRAHALHLRARRLREAAEDRAAAQAAVGGAALSEVRLRLAEDCVKAGRRAEAADLFEAAGALEPARAAYEEAGDLLGAGRVLAALGREAEAAERLERWLAGAGAPSGASAGAGSRRRDEVAVRLARLELSLGRRESAILRLQEVLRRVPAEPGQGGSAGAGQGDASGKGHGGASGVGPGGATGAGPGGAGARTAGLRRDALTGLLEAFAALGWPAAAERTWLRLAPHLDAPPPDWRTFLAERRPETTGDADAPRWVAGRYRLERLLGAGGAGQVHLAHDVATDRMVALKLLAGGAAAADAVGRFFREARIARSLDHPAIVRVLEADPEAGYLAMEYLPGGTLAGALRGGRRLPSRRVAQVGGTLAEALGAAHRRGVLHRDVKPENVLLDEAGRPRLADFGAAHLVAFQQTGTGYLLGTLAYMAPEQLSGGRLSAATDLWGLAVTLYRALTGSLPFPGPDLVEQQRAGAAPPSSRVEGLAPEVDAFFARAFALEPGDRFADTEAFRLAFAALPLTDEAAPTGADAPAWTERGEEAAPTAGGARYEVVAALGGRASLAFDPLLQRHVVLERIPDDPEWARRLAALAHAGNPHVQPVLDLDETAGVAVFGHVAGAPLTEACASPLPQDLAMRLAADVARALVDHPGPVAPGRIVVADGRATVLVAGSDALRTAGAPPADARSAVGRVLGWALTGRDPGHGPGPLEALRGAASGAGPSPASPKGALPAAGGEAPAAAGLAAAGAAPAGAAELAVWLEMRRAAA